MVRDEEITRDAEALFIEQLATIDRAIGFACRRGALPEAGREDFASWAKLKLIDNGYAIIRKFDRRSSFAAYISVVVQRLLLDYRIASWGRWRASAEAQRMGEAAVTIEAMVHRDGRSVEEVLPMLKRRWPELTRSTVEDVLCRLPGRTPRPRDVELELAIHHVGSTADDVFDGAFAAERMERARLIATIIRTTIASMVEDERLIMRLRYEGGMSVADISKMLKIEQKPLYRRIQRGLLQLREKLECAGIQAVDVLEVLSTRGADLDFGFDGESARLCPSHFMSSDGEEGE